MHNDETFLTEFEACRWPADQWHHREHVKLAYLYLCRYSFDEALVQLREGIAAHNDSHAVPNTLTSGYHETMTAAWLHLVKFVIDEYGLAANADAFYETHPELSQPKTLRLFYSQGRMMSAAAKATFVEPDLTPFPVSKKSR